MYYFQTTELLLIPCVCENDYQFEKCYDTGVTVELCVLVMTECIYILCLIAHPVSPVYC